MTDTAPTYRWNTSAAAEAFDAAAEFIHPFYLTIQDLMLDRLPFEIDAEFLIVDLGGGSGRLVERVLARFPCARAALVDQSEPFLALAERRLQRFGQRAILIQKRLQEDWAAALPAQPRAVVSMSAIHHLDAAEKTSLFARCWKLLAERGTFINGDEYRPESDADYLATLEWWAEQKQRASGRGQIPPSFQPVWEAWYDRNIRRFGEPRTSGDDCHETVEAQVGYLRAVGFRHVEVVWSEKLWAVVQAVKA